MTFATMIMEKDWAKPPSAAAATNTTNPARYTGFRPSMSERRPMGMSMAAVLST